jgi:hypothetical protein
VAASVSQVFGAANGSSNATYSGTVTASVAVGDLLVVVANSDGSGTLTSITDAPDGTNFTGNTYTAFLNNLGYNSTTHRFGLFYTVATQALTSGVSKIKFTSGASTNKGFLVLKLSGATSISVDGVGASSINQASSTTVLSGSFTTTQAKELVVIGHAYENTSSPTYTAPAGYSQPSTTQIVNNGATVASSVVYKLVTSTGAQSGSGTLSQANNSAGCIATFKYADAGSAPSNSVAPAVTGTTTVGQTLSTTNGTWTDDGSPTFTYQWQRDVAGNSSYSNIGSATSSTYVLVNADDACHVRCVVTDTDSNGNTSANSNAVGTVIEPVPTNSVAPAVTGTTTVGQTLTSTTGTWANQGGSIATYAYQWQRDVAGNSSYGNISSATSSTYVLVDADDACHVRCVVTATNTGGAGTPANSNATAIVAEPVPTISVAPAVTGTATVGQTLTSDSGTWLHQGGTVATYAYQWQRDVAGNSSYSNISSATSTTYVLVDADDACHVRCVVTATNTGGAGSGANSNAAGLVVEPVPTNSVAPVASGTAQVGVVVSTTTGTWTHQSGTVHTYSYAWQDSADGVTGWANIASATGSSYTVAVGELGLYLRCNVTATNTGGNSAAATASNVLGAVIAAAGTSRRSIAPSIAPTIDPTVGG